MKRLLQVLLVGMLPVAALWAQEITVETPPEERRYTVEMIVFVYTRDIATAGEVFVADDAFAGKLRSDTLGNPQTAIKPAPKLEFSRLDPGDYTMGDIMSELRRIAIYQPVMHFGWTQTTSPEELTRTIRLSSLGRRPAGLDGTVKLYLNRFLHLVVDFEMEAARGDNADVTDSGSPVHYRIQEDRIFRSGELRYFDHPKFGVLAKITRAEA